MKWGVILIALVLIGTMITSTIGFIWKDQSTEDNREKSELDIGNSKIPLDNKINELSTIEIPLAVPVINEKFYIVVENKTYDQIAYKLTKLAASFGIRATKACIDEEGCDINLPIVDCNSTTIIMRNNNQNKPIQADQNCIILQGDYLWVNKLSERLILWIITGK